MADIFDREAKGTMKSKSVVIQNLKRFEVCNISTVSGHTSVWGVAAIDWHPQYPNYSAASSTGGEVFWQEMKTNQDGLVEFVPSRAIFHRATAEGLKFCDGDPAIFYDVGGCFILRNDLHISDSMLLFNLYHLDTSKNWKYNNEFSSLDINKNNLLAGDKFGFSYLLKTPMEVIWQRKKLHEGEITSCEFNKMDPNIFVTSSTDRKVKLWDIRFISDNLHLQTPLFTMNYEKPINSACFSPSNCMSLLVTDDQSQLHIHTSPDWNESFTIAHPHRHTEDDYHNKIRIKAAWHPLVDIIVVGRHPDLEDDLRTIDFYDGSDGKLLHRIRSPTGSIVSLNAFNCNGDTLLSAAGNKLVYMRDKNLKNGVCVHHGSNTDDENEDPSSLHTTP